MQTRDRRPEIEMSLDGQFARPRRSTWPLRLGVAAVVAAIVLGGLALAALALWVALILIPVALVAGVVGYAALRFQLWRTGRSFGGMRYPVRR